MKSAVPYWLSFLVVLGAMYGSWHMWRMRPAAASGNERGLIDAGDRRHDLDFKLTDQSGKEFDTTSLRGRVWVASFFFTSCPSICTRLNQTLAGLQDELAETEVRFVSITVDPKNDTPEVLSKYAERFGIDTGSWTFLTGPIEDIRKIGKESFMLSVDQLTHSDRVVIVDREGRYAAQFRVLEPGQLQLLKKTLSTLLAEEGGDKS